MKIRRNFSPMWNEVKRKAIYALSELFLPYRNTHSYRHRLVVAMYLWLLSETEYADPALVRELQLIRLRKMLRTAETIPWWKERLSKAGVGSRSILKLNDLERFPPVTKHSFVDIPRSELMSRFSPGHERLLLHRTSGTTGVPFEWGVDRNVLFVETASYFHRAITWHGISTARIGGNPFIAAFVHWSYGVPGIEFLWNPIAPEEETVFRAMLDTMRRKKLRVLFSYPTNLILFVKKLAEMKETVPLELVLTTGQRLDDEYREYVEQYLGCPVANLYGAREFGQMAIECPGRRHWYHINSERLFLEITDEFGKRVPDGVEGLITITSLENHVMPLIRYQLGDRGRIVPKKCPCGRTLPLLEFSGRGVDFIRLPGGTLIPFRHINLVILLQFFDEVEFYQIKQTAPDHLVIRLKLRGGDVGDFEKRFLPKLRVYIGNELHVSFEYPLTWDVTPGRKVKMFIPLP